MGRPDKKPPKEIAHAQDCRRISRAASGKDLPFTALPDADGCAKPAGSTAWRPRRANLGSSGSRIATAPSAWAATTSPTAARQRALRRDRPVAAAARPQRRRGRQGVARHGTARVAAARHGRRTGPLREARTTRADQVAAARQPKCRQPNARTSKCCATTAVFARFVEARRNRRDELVHHAGRPHRRLQRQRPRPGIPRQAADGSVRKWPDPNFFL